LDFRKYVEALYDDDELLALVLLGGGKGYGKQCTGFYRDRERFYEDAEALNGVGNVYINLHRLHPDVFGRAANRLKRFSETRFTADEIIWRPRLCVDLDPVRFTGINSTDEELAAALELGEEVKAFIEEQWQEPVLPVHSGNGMQLLMKIDEAPESTLIVDFLQELDSLFSNDRVKVDTSLGDLPRIVRLPGLLNCKGDHITERPRRMAHILENSNVA
jgi:hypothetical protein